MNCKNIMIINLEKSYQVVDQNPNINIIIFFYNFLLDEERNVRIDFTMMYRYEIKYVFQMIVKYIYYLEINLSLIVVQNIC